MMATAAKITIAEVEELVAGDIGCYTLGVLPPWEAMDTCVCMGASITVGLGLRHGLIAGEIATRIDAAVRAGHLPAQDTALAATALLGALHEALVGPLAPDNMDDHGRLRDAVQTVTLLALRAVGVMDARARGLVVQAVLPAVLPAKTLVGA